MRNTPPTPLVPKPPPPPTNQPRRPHHLSLDRHYPPTRRAANPHPSKLKRPPVLAPLVPNPIHKQLDTDSFTWYNMGSVVNRSLTTRSTRTPPLPSKLRWRAWATPGRAAAATRQKPVRLPIRIICAIRSLRGAMPPACRSCGPGAVTLCW